MSTTDAMGTTGREATPKPKRQGVIVIVAAIAMGVAALVTTNATREPTLHGTVNPAVTMAP